MKIRRARNEDLAGIIDLSVQFKEEVDLPYIQELDWDHFGLYLKHCLTDGIAQVAEEDGELVGMILLLVSPIPFNQTLLGSELMFYVNNKHRKGGVARRLLAQAENVARQRKIPMINMMHFYGTPFVGELYQDMGYKELEVTYTKEL